MEEIYEKLSAVNLWQGFENSDEGSFDVVEAWLLHSTGEIRVNRKTVRAKELDDWLSEETVGDGSTRESLVLRLALINCDIKIRQLNLSKDVMKRLLNAFGLRLAYKYSQSCITNVAAIPPLSTHHQTYSFCYMPKLAAVWAHRRFDVTNQMDRPFVTQGLIFLDKSNLAYLSEAFRTPWSPSLYESSMFPAFLLSLILSTQIHQQEEKIKLKIRASEKCTAFQTTSQDYDKNMMSLFIDLATQAEGCAVKLGSLSRKSKMVEKTLNFILKHMNVPDQGSIGTPISSISTEACQLLRNHVLLLQDRLEMQVVDIEYTQKRVQLQTGMLAGLISRGDFRATLILAESQHRDSLSMKTLAIVTMLFLPGSFISALFSTSMFDWDSVDPTSNSIGVRTMPQFRLYWAITIPLTIVTFILFFLWLWMTKLRGDALRRKGDSIKQNFFDRLSEEEKAEVDIYQPGRLRKDTEFTRA
ncbi:uncharacterized protein Triagg1_7077 [Trichoderma aggressivum f. europaeum]|uniref:Uncharacterized protein n=1 Tax=Trichoderma aggressivum f. europaeum TaxID=173218 RepID=A0AAE1IAB9_9HYPO|nr:hypothetical protein Triagg1_7077 [Trichoderma aggressivum f. europaeum]